MNKKLFILCLPVLLLFMSCQNQQKHFITDKTYRTQVENDFQAREGSLEKSGLLAIFDQPMSPAEKEALSFLYAYMPLGDIADYSGEYFLENIRTSFQAREEMPWGKIIPEDIFRHFVLPIRVNNENLDESRMVFYQELKDRVKGLSLHDAVLEVNHWCHEKVIYTPSDARTSSPLASVKTAYGRCGEESTFTVAALRSVGIPARQVYTPRWAHTDDNHAWVEAWVDGKWYFLGACEPEPVLNLGWFNAPASRGMLMHTKVFGKYQGPEEVMVETPVYTEINIIGNYAETAQAKVKIVDENNQPVPGARVEFKVYNYAEFYTVANKTANENGETSLTSGKGDMLVWASKDGKFGYGKISFGKDQEITLTLNKTKLDQVIEEFDIVPPPEKANLPAVTDEQRAENTRRMAQEDSIRNAYVATMLDEERALQAIEPFNLTGACKERTKEILVGSRGNHQTLVDFLQFANERGEAERAAALLNVLSKKDWRDVSLSVLKDHLVNSPRPEGMNLIEWAALANPRISNEMLTPYKAFFQKVISETDANAYREDPTKLVEWVKNNIRIDANCNLGAAPIFPEGVWKARIADTHSRNIFFVALSRALGIPARIDEVTGKVQLMGKNIQDINFEAGEQTTAKTGTLKATYKAIKSLDDPKYYSHFSLSKVVDGRLQLLNYEEGDVDMGAGATWSNLLKNGTKLDEGNYVLVSGTRMASGTVLSRLVFFTIQPGQTTTIDLTMRENTSDIQIIGNFNSENKYQTIEGEEVSLLSTTGRGYYIAAILGARQEPTNHAMRDIAAVKEDLEAWGQKIVLLFPDEDGYKKFDPKEFGELPNTIVYGIDNKHVNQQEMVKALKLDHPNTLPIFIIADTFNRVVFVSQGYTIGLGEQMMQIIHKLQ